MAVSPGTSCPQLLKAVPLGHPNALAAVHIVASGLDADVLSLDGLAVGGVSGGDDNVGVLAKVGDRLEEVVVLHGAEVGVGDGVLDGQLGAGDGGGRGQD